MLRARALAIHGKRFSVSHIRVHYFVLFGQETEQIFLNASDIEKKNIFEEKLVWLKAIAPCKSQKNEI